MDKIYQFFMKLIDFIWNKHIGNIINIILNNGQIKDLEQVCKINNERDIKDFTQKYYQNFIYKYDAIDSIMNPAQAYYNLTTNILKGDCDDYHSAIYFLLEENNYNSALITVVFKGAAHTFTIFKQNIGYGFVDYTNIVYGFKDFDEMIKHIQKIKYENIYITHTIRKFDVIKGRFYNIHMLS